MTESIWRSRLDASWNCEVQRVAASTGKLIVQHDDGVLILFVDVTLAYGAPFGPDVADVAEWESLCVAAVDAWLAEHPDPGLND